MGLGTEKGSGSHFSESAANGFLVSPLIEQAAADLGISLILADPTSSKARFIFSRGKMRRWPLSFLGTLRVLIGLVGALVFRSLKPNKFSTMREWGENIFGREFVDFLLEPGLGGIYASKAENLSASLVVGSVMNRRKQRDTEKSKTRRVTAAPLKGMKFWCESLKRFLENSGRVEILTHKKFESRTWFDEKLKNPSRVFLALDLKNTLEIIKDLEAQASEFAYTSRQRESLKNFIQNLETTPLSTLALAALTLEFNEPPLGLLKQNQGFGCLFPRSENFNSLGVLFNSCIFPARYERKNETYIFGQTQKFSLNFEIASKALGKNLESRLIAAALEDRSRIFDLSNPGLRQPAATSVFVWPTALPCYDIHLEKFLASQSFEGLEKEFGFTIVGNFRGHLSLSKIFDDCWKIATEVAASNKFKI